MQILSILFWLCRQGGAAEGLVTFRRRRSDIFALRKWYWNLRLQWYYIRPLTARRAISLGFSRISLRSNINRRKANIRGCDSSTFAAVRQSRSSCLGGLDNRHFACGENRQLATTVVLLAQDAAFLLTTPSDKAKRPAQLCEAFTWLLRTIMMPHQRQVRLCLLYSLFLQNHLLFRLVMPPHRRNCCKQIKFLGKIHHLYCKLKVRRCH